MAGLTRDQLQARADALRPWRYNHQYDGVMMTGDQRAAMAFDRYARDLMKHLISQLFKERAMSSLRAIDLGCLEGHYSDLLCEAGFKEVVSIDLSEGHVERARFLLQDLKHYPNSRVLQGNVSDESFMKSLGVFNLVLFHGLLYHLKDPLRIFDVLENLVPTSGPFYLLLSTQYRCTFGTLVSPTPMAELQVKPLPQIQKDSQVFLASSNDGSVFERCSFILNPAAVYKALQLYGYQELIAYDDPSGHSYSYHSNLIAAKTPDPGLLERLSENVRIPGVRFYPWDGRSVNSFHFDKNWRARTAWLVMRASRKIAGVLRG
jgi:SAM-dependent methyltransferase